MNTKKIVPRMIWASRMLGYVLMVPIVLLMPRAKKKIVFGAWSGHSFSCNPKYLMEYILRRGGFTCIWVGDRELRKSVLALPNAKFVTKGSLAALWHCLTAKFYAFNVNSYIDIINIPTCRKVVLLYLSHGYPDKRMGDRQFCGKGDVHTNRPIHGVFYESIRAAWLRFYYYMFNQKAWSSASSPQGDELRVLNLPWRLSMDRMLHAGTPRADYILSHAKDVALKVELRTKLSKILGIPQEGRWILYVPTWRHNSKDLFSFSKSKYFEKYKAICSMSNSVVIEKHHPRTLAAAFLEGGFDRPVCIVDQLMAKQIDTQELLLASDLLITDYSSIYYDFYLMNRPVIHFTYDYDKAYTKDFGFDFDIREYGGGPFAYSEEELIELLNKDDKYLLSKRNSKTMEQLSYETGHSCESYYKLLVNLTR